MGVYAEIESDAALRVALGWFEDYPNHILIDTRTFVQIPNAHYDNGNITLNEIEFKVSDHYKAFHRDDNETWVMLGEAIDNYGSKKKWLTELYCTSYQQGRIVNGDEPVR